MNKHFQPSITTGAYGGTELNDEWMWAAAELFITTREKSYLAIVKEHMNLKLQLPSWNNVAMLAYYSLIRFQDVVNKTDPNFLF